MTTKRNALGQWLPGESGNPTGRGADDVSLYRLINNTGSMFRANDPERRNRLEMILEILFERAERGDLKAIEMILDYRYGKARQRVVVDGPKRMALLWGDTDMTEEEKE